MPVVPLDSRTIQEIMARGVAYLDVRSVPEFDAGHIPGAYNIPLMHMGPGGMTPNPNFLAEVDAAFAKDTPLVVGCKAGGRSARAAQLLLGCGYSELYDYVGGYGGGNGDPGWVASGGATTAEREAGRHYEDLRK